MVFMRQPPPGVAPLNPEEVFTSLDAQCMDHLEHEPGKPGCAVGSGRSLHQAGTAGSRRPMAGHVRSDSQRNVSCPRDKISEKVPCPGARACTAAPTWIRPLLLGLTAILFLTWFTGEIADSDIWLHLMTGKHTLETRALTVPDPFSYTSNGNSAAYPGEAKTRYFNLTHEWLAQMIMYSIHAASGFPGLVLLRAVLLIAFCGLVGLMVWWRTRGLLPQPGSDDRGGRGDDQFPAEPAVSDHLSAAGGDDGDAGAAALDVGAGSGVHLLGELPRRLFHGLGDAGRVLRRGADSTPAQTPGGRREAALDGDGGLLPGERR